METPDELIESKAADILVKDGQEWVMRPTVAALMQVYADQFKSVKTTRTYPIICPSCRGAKKVINMQLFNTGDELFVDCPACNGTGIVTCVETT